MYKIILIISIIFFTVTFLNAEIKEITSAEVNLILKGNHDYIILDVRTEDEFREGHIKKAININLKLSDALIKIEKLDRKAKYIVYCRTKNRSKIAVDHMSANGFKNVFHMIDGFVGWQKNNLPVEK